MLLPITTVNVAIHASVKSAKMAANVTVNVLAEKTVSAGTVRIRKSK